MSGLTEDSLILVVDDDDGMRAMLCQAMQQAGYQVAEAVNGQHCLELYQALHPRVVLLDAVMPGMDGFTCCQELTQLSGCDSTAILMITSLTDAGSVNHAFAAGATDYITKPINWTVLCRRVQRLSRQAEMDQLLRQTNEALERQVQQRTAQLQESIIQLQQSLDLEATLKRITDKVRDSLDQDQILQTAVEELAVALNAGCCNASLYDPEQQTSRVCYEWVTTIAGYQGRVIQMSRVPDLYCQLQLGLDFQFCSLVPNSARGRVTMLACPIRSDHRVLGDLWLIFASERSLSELERRLVQQVATQCAIAIRQAQLYQASQAQVTELERLSQLKDDFLSTVSHELRTPITSIKMALTMANIALQQDKPPEEKLAKIAHYLSILATECEQEVGLINDLLMFQELEMGTSSIVMTPIQLQAWLPQAIVAFQERTRSLGQSFVVHLPESLPPLKSSLFCLDRIVTELLTNACKYTPANEQITLIASANSKSIQVRISNSGVEIPASEIPRVFDKFYRISGTDRWKQGGTGLGLALVKRLVEHIGGSIRVDSAAGQTCFTLELPLEATP